MSKKNNNNNNNNNKLLKTCFMTNYITKLIYYKYKIIINILFI